MKQAVISAVFLSAMGLAGQVNAADANLTIGGELEVEMNADTISTPTASINFNKQFNDRSNADVVLLYEDGITAIDSAAINIAPTGEPWSMSIGYIYLPFGGFDTSMATDPVTLSLGETRESAISYNYSVSNLSSSIYLFDGSNNVAGKSVLDNFGFKLTHASALMKTSFTYIDDIGDSNALQTAINTQLGNNDTSGKVPGQSVSFSLAMGAFNFDTELTSAVKAFQAGQVDVAAVQPSGTNTELSYHFQMAGNKSILALGAQSTRDASVLGLPRSRLMLALNSNLQADTHLILQASQDTDYASVVTSNYVIKLVAEF